MNRSNDPAGSSTATILENVRRKGVQLWLDNGLLRFRAPKGALTREEIEGIHKSRSEIVALLERAAPSRTDMISRGESGGPMRAPLAYSQLAHWNLHRLAERPAIRQIAAAVRLRGRLDVPALRESIAEVVRRHDALRTRIVSCEEGPLQEVMRSLDWDLAVEDLASLPDDIREREVTQAIERLILEPVEVAVGPLFAAHLLKLQEQEHVLIVAMEHTISDAFSRGLFLRETFTAYGHTVGGGAVELPVISTQFPEYARRQREAEQAWCEEHGAYWRDRFDRCQRLRFPDESNPQDQARVGRGAVPISIGADLRAQLVQACRVRRITLVMGVMSVYVALVLRWCKALEGTIQCMTDGRMAAELHNTIGFFASPLYLRLALHPLDDFFDLTARVADAFCRASEHADFSYLAAQLPRPDFTLTTAFNWVPAAPLADSATAVERGDPLVRTPIQFVHPMLRKLAIDSEPSVLLYDSGMEITGNVYFPCRRCTRSTMERFARGFLVFVEEWLRRPHNRVHDVNF